MAKVGRKCKYFTHILPHLEEIKQDRLNGLTEETIYKKYGVNRDSFYKYKKLYPELFEVLKHSKQLLVGQIKQSVFQTALGGFVKSKKKFKYIDDPDNEGLRLKILIQEETEVMAPNTTAQIIALKILDEEAREILNNNTIVSNDDYKENQQTLLEKIKEAGLHEK